MIVKRFKYLLIITLLSSVSTLVAQKIDGYFVSRVEQSGTIYFLLPQELFSTQSGSEMMVHDLTVRPTSDTTVLNFTYTMPKATPIDSIALRSGAGFSLGRKVNRLYIEPSSKSGWEHRYSLVGHYNEFLNFYDVEAPTEIELFDKDGRSYSYVADKKAWKKYAPIGSAIFEMIKLNTD